MQAVLKQKDTSERSVESSVSLGFDMPEQVQNSLDRILEYYGRHSMRPIINLQGDPLDITSGLVSKLQTTLPSTLKDEGKILLDFLVREIVSFCREKKVQSLSLNFVFERGGA